MTPEEIKEHAIDYCIFNSEHKSKNYSDMYDDFLAARNKPKLYDGLTTEQWGIVIKEGLVCEFWDINEKPYRPTVGRLVSILSKHGFEKEGLGASSNHCRIHPSQPQFFNGTRPEGLDDAQSVLARFSLYKGVQYMPIKSLVGELAWKYVERYQVLNL